MRDFYLVVFVLMLMGCASSTLIPNGNRISFTTETAAAINGRYENNSTDTVHWKRTTFWEHLKPFPNGKDSGNLNKPDQHNSFIEITLVDDNKIRFDQYDAQVLHASKTFRYVIENGIILIRGGRNIRWEGIPLLFFRQHNETLNLALSANGNLILSYDGSASGGVLILNFGTRVGGTHTFRRK